MGLFDWLTSKKDTVEIAPDRIWLSREAKLAGIRNEAAQAVVDPAGPSAVVVVAHFNDCLEQLHNAIAGLDPDRVFVLRADALSGQIPTRRPADESRPILFLVGERHPLQARDAVVIDFARNQSYRCRIVQHVSLEDTLMKRFSGEWVERVLRSMGMKENESIESRMVSRRFLKEMKKIERSAIGDTPANSAEEWLERNCP